MYKTVLNHRHVYRSICVMIHRVYICMCIYWTYRGCTFQVAVKQELVDEDAPAPKPKVGKPSVRPVAGPLRAPTTPQGPPLCPSSAPTPSTTPARSTPTGRDTVVYTAETAGLKRPTRPSPSSSPYVASLEASRVLPSTPPPVQPSQSAAAPSSDVASSDSYHPTYNRTCQFTWKPTTQHVSYL